MAPGLKMKSVEMECRDTGKDATLLRLVKAVFYLLEACQLAF